MKVERGTLKAEEGQGRTMRVTCKQGGHNSGGKDSHRGQQEGGDRTVDTNKNEVGGPESGHIFVS